MLKLQVFVLFLLTLTICDSAVLQSPFDKRFPSLSIANSEFNLKLYHELSKGTSENIVFSPYSLSTALSMLLEGAGGTTATEILTALGSGHIPTHIRNREYLNTMSSLRKGQDYDLEVANAIWTREDYPVLQSFQRKLSELYDATKGSFVTQTGHETINKWVAEKTKGKIRDLLGRLDHNTVMFLVNVVYFKGNWLTAFNSTDNFVDEFNSLPPGPATYMKLRANLRYGESDILRSKILHLPYQGEEMKMILILPNEGVTLNDIERNLNAQTLIQEIKSAKSRPVHLSLPKFKIQSTFDLKSDLQRLGIREAFTDFADLTGITPHKNLKVSKVIQKAIIEVSEEGSVAAAATGIGFATRSSHNYNYPVKFNANRPFLFAVFHSPTNTIVFFGRVRKP